MAAAKDGCVKPSRGPILPEVPAATGSTPPKEAPITMMARVGQPAPDFEVSAYIGPPGFENVRLSDYKGKWVILCFYPGDFTFV